MKKPFFAFAVILILSLIGALLLSCEKKCTCPVDVETVGDYDLLYIHAGGILNDTLYALYSLNYSTETGSLNDTILTLYHINDLHFTQDGLRAVMSIDNLGPIQNSVLAIDYPSFDTMAIFDKSDGYRIYFSPDEQEVISCFGSIISILSFPDLTPIFIDTVDNYDGGFLTSTDSAFYLVSGIDSIFVIDYTNRQDVAVTSATIGSASGGGTVPGPCAVDYINNRMILVLATPEGNSHIHVLNSDDLSSVQWLWVDRRYDGKPGIRPYSDEVYLKYGTDIGEETDNLIDVYNVTSNTLSNYLRSDDILFWSYFSPRILEFTPNGNSMFVLTGSNLFARFSVLAFNLDNDKVNRQLEPEKDATANLIRINPINKN